MLKTKLIEPTTHYHNCPPEFKQLHQHLKNRQYDSALRIIPTLGERINLNNFCLTNGSYARHVLSTKDNYWLSLVRWDKAAQTPIHGHSEQMFNYLLFGELFIEQYEAKDLTIVDKIVCRPHQYHKHHGVANRQDNAIHRVFAKQQSMSLHFYSDDPRKGKIFECD